MHGFDPIRHVENAAAILDTGAWPNFHDARVNELHLDRGDIRPEDNVWQGPWIEAALTLCALREPCDVRLRFEDCEGIALQGFDTGADIDDIEMGFEPRGFYGDGVTPLTPHVRVRFVGFGVPSRFSLEFRCLRVVALGRAAVSRLS